MEDFQYLESNPNISVKNKVKVGDYLDNDLGKYTRRELDLGIDPDRSLLSIAEIRTAVTIENRYSIELTRYNIGDWIDQNGLIYDAIGPIDNPEKYFDYDSFTNSITEGHLYKPSKSIVSKFVVSMLGHPPSQIEQVESFLNSLLKEDFNKIIFIY